MVAGIGSRRLGSDSYQREYPSWEGPRQGGIVLCFLPVSTILSLAPRPVPFYPCRLLFLGEQERHELRSCLEFALHEEAKLGGVFGAIHDEFSGGSAEALLEAGSRVNDCRVHKIKT